MAHISTELGFLVFVIIFFGIYTFLTSLPDFPAEIKFISPISTGFFTLGIPAVAGACTVITGLGCAIAMGIYVGANLLIAYFSPNSLISLLIMTPLMVGVIYVVSRLARGGG